MAAPVIETLATTNWVDGSTTLTLTKPASLAVGNLLLAFASGKEGGPTFTWDDKAGWTTVGSQTYQGDGIGTKVYAKTADSGDVAASDFTFVGSHSNGLCGIIYRISGPTTTLSNIVIAAALGGSGSSASQVYANTITPAADSIIIQHFTVKDVATTNGTYAIVTSNPSWTERFDNSFTTLTDVSCANASATRPEATATGNGSCTWGTVVNGGSSLGIQVGVPPVSGPANLKSLDTNLKANIKSYNTNVIGNVKSINTNV